MSLDHQITKRAALGVLTIAELRQFLAEFDKAASPSSAPEVNGTKIKAQVTFRGGLKSVTVTVPDGGEQR